MAEIDNIHTALSFIDSGDREVWVNVGNALKGEFGANGLDIWLDWSSDAANFDRKAALSVWKSLKRFVVPIGYIFKLAKEFGYVQDSAPKVISAEEKASKLAQQKELRDQEALAASKNAEDARVRSITLWQGAKNEGHSPYLARKQVIGESIRYLADASILVPMLQYDQPRENAFVGVQTIKKDGTKLFPKGVAKSGSACRLGDQNDVLIAVCEGYATGCSIRLGLDYKVPVYVAFDAGNMIKVVQMLRSLYPKPHILVCADNDAKTKNNPGIRAGLKAIKQIDNASIIYPIFPVGDKKSSDFNDLHVLGGASVLATQFYGVMQAFKARIEACNG